MHRNGPGIGTPVAGLLGVTALGLLAAACGGRAWSNSASPSTTSPRTASASGSAAAGRTVAVDETECRITLSTLMFTSGTYTFRVVNKGTATHALEIDGPGVKDRKSGTVSPGADTSMTVTLEKGSYEVYCPVDGHRGLGMQTKITVS